MEPTLTPKLAPYLVVNDARGLSQFLETALGGRTTYEQVAPDGRRVHVEVRVADGLVMMGDAPPGHPPFPAMIHLYVEDATKSYERALAAGATSVRVPERSPDGLVRGGVSDRWGNQWWFSTHP